MLAPTNPKTLKTLEEIQRLEFLRDTVVPFVKEREKEGLVDFNHVFHQCGTPSCLLGWCNNFKELGFKRGSHFLGSGDVFFRQAMGIFGFDGNEERNGVFGASGRGTLDDRAQAITRIIERKRLEIGL